MQKKIALITGATSGIGLETALALSRQGIKVIIVGRDEIKIHKTIQHIKNSIPHAELDFLLADLSKISDIKNIAEQFSSRYESLDILVNNAGGFFLGNQKTHDGFEKTWMTNYLSPVYLTELLLPQLQMNKNSRIINVSSKLHLNGKLDFNNLNGETSFKASLAYANSKLALVMYTYSLADRLSGSGVTVNVLHPGIIATGIWLSAGGPKKLINFGTGLLVRLGYLLNAEQGAQTSIFLASSNKVEGVTGKYFDACEDTPSKRTSYDKDLQQKLMHETRKSLSLS